MSQTPYKHRLAHAPGRRSRSGRAFRCVGFLGRSPKPFLHPFVGTKGCPRRVGVQIMPFIRPSPPRATANQPRRRAVQIMITKRLAPPKAISRYNLTGRGARVRDCDLSRKYPAGGEQKLCHVHLPEGKAPPGAGFWVGYFTMVIRASGVPGFCWTAVKNSV